MALALLHTAISRVLEKADYSMRDFYKRTPGKESFVRELAKREQMEWRRFHRKHQMWSLSRILVAEPHIMWHIVL